MKALSARTGAFVKGEISGWRAGEVAWLVFCLSAIVSLSLYWRDSAAGTVAAVTGMMYTILAGKGRISCYLFGLVNTPVYAWLSWKHGYYGDMALNLYYFAMMFPGFLAWSRNRDGDRSGEVRRTRLGFRERVSWCAGAIAAAMALYPVLAAFGGSRPLADAFTNVLSVAAMILTVKRCVEQWVMWIAVDAIEVFMWWKVYTQGGDISVLLMWLLFLVNGIYLFGLWCKKSSLRTSGGF